MYDKVCGSCGTRLSDFYKTGIVGCENCYSVFKEEIENAVSEIQVGNVHKGKVPPFSSEEKSLLFRYEKLFKDKELAVMEGRFADVKAISAELIDLKEQLKEKGLI